MDSLFFRTRITKSLVPTETDDRFFEGVLTVQMKDKQGEVTITDELMKVLPIWMDRGAPITDTHSNRVVGKGINFSRVEGEGEDGEMLPAIKITGKIHKNYELDHDIWGKIKSGEYKGLSFGGATKAERQPIRMKDGSIAYTLGDLEHYEVAVCADPAVPLALITDYNPLAKASTMAEDLGNGKMLIKCDNYGCYVNKDADLTEEDTFEKKVQKLVADGKTQEQAEKIVGSFVKSKPDELTGEQGLTSEGNSDVETDGNNHSMYNQDVNEDGSSGRRNVAVKEEWQGSGSPQPKEMMKEKACWEGYKQSGMKEQDGKMVPNCVPNSSEKADDKKPLNKPMRDDGDKKFKVYVKDPKTGNTVTVRFGDPNMEIRRDDPEARSSFRARHKCDQQNDKTSAAYWSCKMWEKSSTVSDNISKANWEVWLEKDLQQPDGGMRGLGGYNTSQQGADDIAQVSEVKSEDAKHEENYIKDNNKESDSNMADENKKPEEEVKAEHAEEEAPVEKTEEEIDDKNKAFDAISVQLKSIIKGQKSLGDRIKALETPTDLPLTPKVSDKDDIGAEVKAPDTYQSNSVQAGLDDDKSGEKKPEGDEGSLAMQEKSLVTKSSNTFTTETPRPSAALETIEKSSGKDYSPILKDARAQGYEGLSQVAQNILAGKYYTPTSDEVGTY